MTLTGKEAHTGSTPMPMRVNAGLGVARIIDLVNDIAWRHPPLAVGAVGHMDVYPELAQHHPGQGRLHRRFPPSRQGGDRRDGGRRSATEGKAIADELKLGMEIEQVGALRPGDLRRGLRQGGARRRRAARLHAPRHRLGRRPRRLLDQPRRADRHGHVPLRRRPQPQRGRGDLSKEWATAGADVLFHAVVETAEIVA